MTKEEFESRTGLKLVDSHFEKVNDVYMAAGELVNKDTFCKAYKEKTDNTWFVMNQLSTRVYDLMDMNDELREQVKGLNKEKIEMAYFLIDQAHENSASDLAEKAIEILGEKPYIVYKIEKGYGFWKSDKEIIKNLLK